MDIDIHEVVGAVSPVSAEISNPGFPIRKISTDTRTLEKDDLFFALQGPKFDGHHFVREAFEKGSRNFVLSKQDGLPKEFLRSANFLFVPDTLRAYGDLARHCRKKFSIPAVAVTGSAGKTTVKELTAHLLSSKFAVLKNRGTENNLVGVPKTLFQLEASHQVIVVEMGTSQPGEIERLSSIISPQIGASHLEKLRNLEGVKEEKLSLVNHLERGGILVVNGEDPLLKEVPGGVHKVLRVGFSKENNDFFAAQGWCHEKGSSFYLNGKDLMETPLLGRHNILNCLLAIAVAVFLGVELETIRKLLSSFKPVSGRLQLKNIEGILFLDDTYNANPHSFQSALETLKEFKIREKKGVVCGDMLELGEQSEMLHRELGAFLAGSLFDFVVAAGPLSKYTVDEALKKGFDAKRIHHAKDSLQAGKICRGLCSPGDMVLVKGSRGMQMEKVFECFITSSIR